MNTFGSLSKTNSATVRDDKSAKRLGKVFKKWVIKEYGGVPTDLAERERLMQIYKGLVAQEEAKVAKKDALARSARKRDAAEKKRDAAALLMAQADDADACADMDDQVVRAVDRLFIEQAGGGNEIPDARGAIDLDDTVNVVPVLDKDGRVVRTMTEEEARAAKKALRRGSVEGAPIFLEE